MSETLPLLVTVFLVGLLVGRLVQSRRPMPMPPGLADLFDKVSDTGRPVDWDARDRYPVREAELAAFAAVIMNHAAELAATTNVLETATDEEVDGARFHAVQIRDLLWDAAMHWRQNPTSRAITTRLEWEERRRREDRWAQRYGLVALVAVERYLESSNAQQRGEPDPNLPPPWSA